MPCMLVKALVASFILTDVTVTVLAGSPAPPIWTKPEVTSFTFEFTDTTGCDDVTRLSATPQIGQSVTLSVVSEGPEGGFDTVTIDGTNAKLTCDQNRIVDDRVYNVHVRAVDPDANEFADIQLVITASKTLQTDQKPVFEKPNPDATSTDHVITIAETAKGGDSVYFLSAKDPDTATALLTYSMDDSDSTTRNLFVLNGNKLSVQTGVVEGTFDYDKDGAVRQYPISLLVSDGVLSSSINTHIVVQDINDNIPVFETITAQDVYESTTAGSSVFEVTASDADGSPENSQVKYSMTGSGDFVIDETTGIVSVASGTTLDYDQMSKYTLVTSATDDVAGNALSAAMMVTVNIITAPRFVNLASETTTSVSDAATAETSIFELIVIDKDEDGSPSVTLKSQSPGEMFRLDGYVLKPKTGVTFDKDTQSKYTLTFSASDGNIDVTSAVLTVNIVKDGTTTPKPIVNPFVIRILSEDTQAGTFVVNIDTVGLNSQNNIVFSMNGGDGDFVVDVSSGIVTVASDAHFDYTNTQSYSLLVTASDGTTSTVTPVIVYIKTSPIFVDPADSSPQTTVMLVPENIAPRANIKSLTAMDEDQDALTYSIVSQTPSTTEPVFEINGYRLRASRTNTLDTFDVDAANVVLEYTLQLMVSDGRVVSVNDTVDITITITDSNEPPEFPVEEYPSQTILESTTEGSVVFTVTATDDDRTPENRNIQYSISGTTEFEINSQTGGISLAMGTILNQTDVPVYSFTIIATDSGDPAMSASVYVTFNIFRDGCPILTDEYGTWPVTKTGDTTAIKCNGPYEGNISRVCETSGIWSTVSSYCRVDEDVFKDLERQLAELSNSTEDVASDIEEISKNLTEITNIQPDSSVIENVIGLSQDIVGIVENTRRVTDNGTEYFFETISNIVTPGNEDAWNETDVEGSTVLDVVDRYVAVLQAVQCNGLNDGEVDEIEKAHLYTEIGRKSGNVTFPNNRQLGSTINIPEDTISNTGTGITDVCFGGSVYNSVGNILEKQVEKEGTVTSFSDGQQVNSDVISIQLQSGVPNTNLNPPISVTLTLVNETLSDAICVFWNFNLTNESGDKGAWSPDGCLLVNITNTTATCECRHLTNFAILMSPSKVADKHAFILGIISAVGCAISMVCLVLTIAAHCMVWRIVRSNRTITLMNLCVALFLALAVFLAGVNRTESSAACAAIAALIQYLFLTVFFLMLLTGIEILLSVVRVFGTPFPITRLLPLAWLAAGIVVGVSLGVTKSDGYGNDEFCWLDIDSGVIWSFLGPVLLVICVNFVIIGVVFKKISSSKAMQSKSSKVKLMTNLRSLCVLLPVMGLSWLFGVLSVNSDLFILQYLFCILNTLQGLCIFLFHCVFNRQIRDALRLRRERRKTLETFTSELRNTKNERSRNFEKENAMQSNIEGQDNGAYVTSNSKNEELLLHQERK